MNGQWAICFMPDGSSMGFWGRVVATGVDPRSGPVVRVACSNGCTHDVLAHLVHPLGQVERACLSPDAGHA
jgi:hypothetical protein